MEAAYICSDARNFGLRQLLRKLENVRIYASAGNYVDRDYVPEIPGVVFAHGKTGMKRCCGAVDHCVSVVDEQAELFSDITQYIKPDIIENAEYQLSKIPAKYRAGILFFDQDTGTLTNFKTNEHNAKYSHCLTMYNRLKECLEGRYTAEDLKEMAEGQNPELIYLTNFNSRATTTDLFRVDLQGSRFSRMTEISMGYAMVHALNGSGSFRDTKSVVMGFDKRRPVNGLTDFLKNDFVHEYVGPKKEGNIYLVGLGNVPEAIEIFKLKFD